MFHYPKATPLNEQVAVPVIDAAVCIVKTAFSLVLPGNTNLINGSWLCTASLAAARANLLWNIGRLFPVRLNDSISLAAIPSVLIPGCSSTRYSCGGLVKSKAVISSPLLTVLKSI